MPVFLLNAGSDPEAFESLRERLAAAIPGLAMIANLGEIARQNGPEGGGAFVLIAAPVANRDYFSRLLEIVTRYRGEFFFVLVGGDISAADYKTLVQSGSADWVAETAPAQEIVDIISRRNGAPATMAQSARRQGPEVISFLPSAGGVGNSTLAIETAVQLAKAKGGAIRRVCLIDLDVQTSHVCDYLDMTPRLRLEEFVAAPKRLDAQLLDAFSSRHGSGLSVFAAPRNRQRSVDLTIEALDAFFEKVAQTYDVILVDLPPEWRPWTVHVLAASHGIVVTGVNVIPGLRQIVETLAAIRSEQGVAGRILVAINRCEIGAFGRIARRQHVDAVLGGEQTVFVRQSGVAIECANTGAPISVAYPSHKIVKEIAGIVKFCNGLAAPAVKK